MGTNSPNGVTVSTTDEVEDNDTTVEIKIKTLDSQMYTLRVNKCVPVPTLKEQIATVTGVLSEQQRLICRGRVLRDDQLLSEYHVEDGHTLHLVSRQPIPSQSEPSMSAFGSEGAPGHQAFSSDSTNTENHGNHVAHTIVLEAVNIDPGDRASGLSRIISSVLNSIASVGTGSGHPWTDLREAGSERFEGAPGISGSADVPHPQPTSAYRGGVDSRQAANRFPSSANLDFQHPVVIPDSLTTINQYLGFMREAFGDIPGGDPDHNMENNGAHISDGQNHGLQSLQGGLPSLTSLAETLLSARELLVEHAGGHLSQLARQLMNQASVTDPLMRMNMQTSAVRSGVVLQNLGSLLLELGRTTMTLRMGQTPVEAVVNTGPAVYISASGPNAMLVQPAPFYPGSNFGFHMGATNLGHGLEGQRLGSTSLPRNVDIQIHAGHTTPVTTSNLGDQSGAQQTPEQTGQVRNSPVVNLIHQALSGAIGSSSPTGESGVRVVPIRPMVAVPAGVNRSPSDSSGRPAGVFYARIRRQNSGNANDSRGRPSSSEPRPRGPENDQRPIHESSMPEREGNHVPTNPILVPGMSVPANESAQNQGSARNSISNQTIPSNSGSSPSREGQQTGEGYVAQMISGFDQFIRSVLTGEETAVTRHQGSGTDSATNQTGTVRPSEASAASVDGLDEGIFFSNMIRQIMPFIPQATASAPNVLPTNTNETAQENSTDPSSSSVDRRDPPEAPNSKRQKRD